MESTQLSDISDLDLLFVHAMEQLRISNGFLEASLKPSDRTGYYFVADGEYNKHEVVETNKRLLASIRKEIMDRQSDSMNQTEIDPCMIEPLYTPHLKHH